MPSNLLPKNYMTVASCTPEQLRRATELLEKNIRLAKWGTNRHIKQVEKFMDWEELYAEMLEALWIACIKWDPKKGALSTYAVVRFRHAASLAIVRQSRGSKVPKESNLSLDYIYGEDATLYDKLTVEEDHTGLDVEKFLAHCSEREQRIFELRVTGFTLEDISQVTGVTRERVRQILKGAYRRQRKFLDSER